MEALIWTWDQYKQWVSQNTRNNYNYLFRGQENPQWILQTTFHRYFPHIQLPLYINNIIPEVHNQLVSQGFESHNLQDINGFNSFLAKLQHHGFPTPLLDWTYSPFISVFFAIKNLQDHDLNSGYFSVYIFDYLKWISHTYQPVDLLNNNNPFVSTYRPYYANNPRLVTQQSILTITNVSNIESYLSQFNVQYLYKINISRQEVHEIRNDLENMGVTENRLFPNFDNICTHLKNHFISHQT